MHVSAQALIAINYSRFFFFQFLFLKTNFWTFPMVSDFYPSYYHFSLFFILFYSFLFFFLFTISFYLFFFLLATVVSHNVPPYGRAGLYQELSSMKDLLGDLRNTYYDSTSTSASSSSASVTSSSSAQPSSSSSSSSSVFLTASSLSSSTLKKSKNENENGSDEKKKMNKRQDLELLKNLLPIIPMIATAAEKSGNLNK